MLLAFSKFKLVPYSSCLKVIRNSFLYKKEPVRKVLTG